jgi:hypothetical protein
LVSQGGVLNAAVLSFVPTGDPHWKYRLTSAICHQWFYRPVLTTDHARGVICCGGFVTLTSHSVIVRPGYAWDGATGALDTMSFAHASLLHDVWCQAMSEGVIEQSRHMWINGADELRILCERAFMGRRRVMRVYLAVRYFGGRQYWFR